ncbi:MAG: magnesium-translocating P-type ATPase [Anaerolineales bacterium]|nr:magnesium-translocating P-type ATPase [Anaerolineales bacterium]MDW8447448.1 magnesium-translocating P-type ATPase [Anaerolineales bacterium]
MNNKIGPRTDSVEIAVAKASRRLIEYSQVSPEKALHMLDTKMQGLSAEEAVERLKVYGKNEVAHEKAPAWYVQMARAFINPFNMVLMILAVVSFFLDVVLAAPEERDFTAVIIISTMVTVSGLLRFWQEFRSNRAAEQLRAMVRTTATVERQGAGKIEIPLEEIVPGDIVHLSAGDMIPADLLLLRTKDLFVSQAVLTGESLPVEKYDILADVVEKRALNQVFKTENPLELPNICFMGTSVVSGSATAVVVATGSKTYFGSMSRGLIGQRATTSFDRGVNQVSWVLIRFMLTMVPVIFLINGLTKGDWFEALLFGLAVAVGLTPEMLPMVVTANLAKGAIEMAQHKTIVKRLNSIQNFGAMDVLCTDKTGTLTQDNVVLVRYLDVEGKENLEVLREAYLNSYYQTGLRNLLDVAVLEHEDVAKLGEVEKSFVKVDEIPFDFVRRRMSVVVQNGDGKHRIITKGAVEEMLGICSFVELSGQQVELTPQMRKQIREMTRDLNEDGLRVLVVAYKVVTPVHQAYSVADEKDMVIVGYIGFLDPPKETASDALLKLREHGINIKILTGDNEVVTRRICREVNLEINGVLLGHQLDAMTDDELSEAVDRVNVFAKMTPLHKSRVIRILKQKGHTVGYLGDGINDAAALRDADIGISVDTAVDIAKEAADIILLEKSLLVLEEGVVRGRKVFGNIMKYIKMAASSNFGNVFSVLVASAFLPFQPMMPLHLLIQNLLYDISQISIPWDNVDEDFLKVPRKWQATGIARFMIFIGPVSSIFDITTYLLMWFVFGANTIEEQALFQSGWFVEGLLSQTLIVHMIRTRKIPFFQSIAAPPVLLLTGTIMAIGIIIPFTPLGASVGMVPLPATYFPWLVATLLAYATLAQIVKMWYIRRFKSWLD